ncbi:Glutathione S-transferase 2 [Metarhizium acridum]|nr:Glutathione S-transferase 2 [Metarhizium acridum]
MQGQANHFVRFAKEKIAYGMQRYVGETERLYGILDARLKDRDFVVGPGRGKYSIADIALLGWVNAVRGTTISIDQFPSVKAWFGTLLGASRCAKGLPDSLCTGVLSPHAPGRRGCRTDQGA